MDLARVLEPMSHWPVNTVSAGVIAGEEQASIGDPDTQFELASVTKLLSAYGVLMAIEEGIFDLESPLGPEGSTVRHLLSHASGVGFHSRELEKPVGQRRIYSSAGFEILAEAIEQEAEMSFAEYLRLGVFEPLQMNSTHLWGSAGHEARSTVHDLLRFSREVLKPTLLAQESVDTALSIHFPELKGIVPGYGMQNPCPWGLGFEIKGEKKKHWTAPGMPAETVGHFGMAGTFLWLVPAKGWAVVALTDRDFGDWAKPLWAETNTEVYQALGEYSASTQTRAE
ncbi:serine hydrolase domain-containing protein [Corynebacterium tapiri]|uniref:Beta-lactamase family protein n=1 Tax=Corynebacterium tapiri TaxID=1448266 RepID=A0A5C4U4P4_9CORY|nr:serine hydrolase domain-containing protein [Corynebacterium tapiri]TNL98758.1 beta-lactamase family protein [Corynebacterium tapiri]